MLIGVDWGTTRLRAYLIGDGGTPVARQESSEGLLAIKNGAFEAALERTIDAWHDEVPPGTPVIMSGMVGSRQGWVEAPYADPPATIESLAGKCATVETARLGTVRIVPGVAIGQSGDGWADVMRGEETEIIGALDLLKRTDATFVLPGTHAKWVTVEGGAITHFQTFMTGDVYAAVRDHTILSRLMDADADDEAAFEKGLAAARGLSGPGAILARLFSVRAEGLMGRLGEKEAASFLSGLLVGAEVASAASGLDDVIVVGASKLAERYRQALAAAGVTASVAPPECAARGLALIAARLG